MLEALVFDDKIAESARLEELLNVQSKLGEEGDELGVILARDVGLEPHLEDAEHLLFQKERDMNKWERRAVWRWRARLRSHLRKLRLKRSGLRAGLVVGGKNERLFGLHDFTERAEEDAALLLVILKKRRLQFDRRRELQLVLSLRRTLPDEPHGPAAAIARGDNAREELLVVFLRAHLAFAEGRYFIHEPLDTGACGFDSLWFGHRAPGN